MFFLFTTIYDSTLVHSTLFAHTHTPSLIPIRARLTPHLPAHSFDPTRLHYQGYNITILHEIFCEAGWATFIGGNDSYVPDTPLIQALTTTFSTYIWIFQAVSAMNNDPYRLKQLCGLIILEPSFNVGLNATLVQDSICGAGEGKVLPKVLELPVPFEDLRKSRLGNGTKGVETFVEAAGRG